MTEHTSPDDATRPAARRLADAPDSPWHTRAAREVYRNPWLTVTEYAVTRPDGSPGIYGVVDPGDNVTVVALDDDERVWGVEDFIYPIQGRGWHLPSGAINADEEPLAAAQRELAEETGLRATDWQELGAFYLSPGISNQRSYLFLARGLSLGASQREGTEASMVSRLLPLSEACALSQRSPTASTVTALGLLLVRERLHGAP